MGHHRGRKVCGGVELQPRADAGAGRGRVKCSRSPLRVTARRVNVTTLDASGSILAGDGRPVHATRASLSPPSRRTTISTFPRRDAISLGLAAGATVLAAAATFLHAGPVVGFVACAAALSLL